MERKTYLSNENFYYFVIIKHFAVFENFWLEILKHYIVTISNFLEDANYAYHMSFS